MELSHGYLTVINRQENVIKEMKIYQEQLENLMKLWNTRIGRGSQSMNKTILREEEGWVEDLIF